MPSLQSCVPAISAKDSASRSNWVARSLLRLFRSNWRTLPTTSRRRKSQRPCRLSLRTRAPGRDRADPARDREFRLHSPDIRPPTTCDRERRGAGPAHTLLDQGGELRLRVTSADEILGPVVAQQVHPVALKPLDLALVRARARRFHGIRG